ncbi:MAG: hypothetical protein L0H73_18745, partial [Nitrococcus sp.]|nr:hypothetical protein [Nitrococcus sp.]
GAVVGAIAGDAGKGAAIGAGAGGMGGAGYANAAIGKWPKNKAKLNSSRFQASLPNIKRRSRRACRDAATSSIRGLPRQSLCRRADTKNDGAS